MTRPTTSAVRLKHLDPDFQNSDDRLASLPTTQNLQFEREDWTSFRTIDGLQQKAGVTKDKLTRLMLKELADNGLDTGANIEIGELPNSGYFVEDDGTGIEGSLEDIARLFSIKRPMVTSKMLRLPTRGALGNGLRVVAGAVLASSGSLVVITRNRRIALRPERDGSTTVISAKPVKFPVGTRVEISFGRALPKDANAFSWAKIACRLAHIGSSYSGKSSPQTIERLEQRRPVADYVRARKDTAPDGETWEEWLQTHRVELNAMTTPQFIAWLDRKTAEHGDGKLIPPEEVVAAELEQRLEAKVRAAVTERILREAGLEDQIVEAIKTIEQRPSGGGLVKGIEGLFKRKPEADWRAYVEILAAEFIKKARRL